MQITVAVTGYGSFQIDNDKISELIGWLNANKAVYVTPGTVKEVKNEAYTGRTLINE